MPDLPDSLAPDHIRALLPDTVAVSFSTALPDNAGLLPEEAEAIDGMVAKRLDEYTHGRFCAREALELLGETPAPIPRTADRSPQWPAGIVGSITHSGALAAAAVGHRTAFVGIGLDIETAEPLDSAAYELILRPDERTHYSASDAKLVFSIKEALYKCIYPMVQHYVDFQEMHIDLDRHAGRYTATPHTDTVNPALIADLQGRFVVTKDYVASGAWIAAAGG